MEENNRVDILTSARIYNNAFKCNLIVDNHAGSSREVGEFVQGTNGRLKLFFVPPYSPELKPDEHVWNYVKNYKCDLQSTKNGYELSYIIITAEPI